MAEDWIKMRVNLCTHPKVARIARIIGESLEVGAALRSSHCGPLRDVVTCHVTCDVTIASLFRVWAAANEHTTDGIWHGLEINDLDRIAGVPGFGAAMQSVGWATQDTTQTAVILPDFLENNVPAKGGRADGAQRQRECRARKKAAEAASRSDSLVTASRHKSDTSVTERERERESRDNAVTVTSQSCDNAVTVSQLAVTCNTAKPDWLPSHEEIDALAQSDGPINWPNEFADCLMIWMALPTGKNGVVPIAGLQQPQEDNARESYRMAWGIIGKRDREAFMTFWPARKTVAIEAMQAIGNKAINWETGRDPMALREFGDEIDNILGQKHKRRAASTVAARTKRTRVDDIQDMLSDFGNHIDASLAVPSTKIETTATRKLT